MSAKLLKSVVVTNGVLTVTFTREASKLIQATATHPAIGTDVTVNEWLEGWIDSGVRCDRDDIAVFEKSQDRVGSGAHTS